MEAGLSAERLQEAEKEAAENGASSAGGGEAAALSKGRWDAGLTGGGSRGGGGREAETVAYGPLRRGGVERVVCPRVGPGLCSLMWARRQQSRPLRSPISAAGRRLGPAGNWNPASVTRAFVSRPARRSERARSHAGAARPDHLGPARARDVPGDRLCGAALRALPPHCLTPVVHVRSVPPSKNMHINPRFDFGSLYLKTNCVEKAL